ncbi:MAG TPA: GTPase ObgE [Syntrophomonadaceae bacterium]|nr:GTPase ObgE [Syntrophomonadaceae bacterium]HPR92476.1 GTPase ObgE [Syntrophomonadaceae bacterium]
MFVDYAKINVKAGDGGNGVVAFRREKYVPMGGPSGGDGGRGGSIVIKADEGLSTLMDFKYRRHFKGERGQHGQGKNMHGAGGEDTIIRVPPGTVIKDDESEEVIADLTRPGQEVIVAKGGRGGKGNARFATAINKAPSLAERGEPGEEKWIRLELKLLADVGLVGYPNAGKSTLISQVSAAKPKIADYPFTTLVPNLGVVRLKGGESFVLADIPGLIEGANEGAGLGHRFLRHIERTRVLIYVLDAAQTEDRNVLEDYNTLGTELEKFHPDLARKPFLIAANKMDIPEAEQNIVGLQEKFGDKLMLISAATGQGTAELMARAYELLTSIPAAETVTGDEVVQRRFNEEPAFVIEIVDGVFEVSGKRIEKLAAMTNFDSEEGLQRFQRTINRMGLEDALREQGIQAGQTVRIKDLEFDYSE